MVLKKSKGKLIYRIGVEFVLEPDVIEKCVNKIKEGYDALAVHNRSRGESIWAKVRFIERESYRNDDTIVAVRFMKSSVFKKVGMFDEDLVAGEDFDLDIFIRKKYCRSCWSTLWISQKANKHTTQIDQICFEIIASILLLCYLSVGEEITLINKIW